MEIPEGASTLQGRIESFSTAHHLSKRRASSVKKRTPQTVSWPHTSPQPEELARAGFFYKPTADSIDNCMCFVCHRQLDGWEEGDDPIAEHLKHAPECGWAINASITKTFQDGGQVTEDPMSDQLAQSRVDTFGEHWPYEQKKGWKCKVTKMVAAGWCYDPSPEFDDGVTCSYCSLSLDGWERCDDPFVEHQRRAPDCEFFKLLDQWSASREQVKTKKGKGRASRGSKASRLSTQSMVSTVSEAPSQLSLGDPDEPAGEDDSVLTTATNTTAKGRKKAKATNAKGKGKGAKGKKLTSMAVDDSIMHSEPPVPIEEIQVIEEPPKRQTRRKVSRNETSHIEDTLNSSQIQKPTRTKATRGKAKQRVTEDETQLQAELQASIDATLIEREETPKPTRGTKRMSNGAPKLDSSVIFLEEAPADPQEKPKRGRKPKSQRAQVEVEEQDENAGGRASIASEAPQRVSSIPTKGPKSKKGKKGAKAPVQSEPEIVEPEPEDEEMQDFDFAQSLVNPINPYQPMEGTPEHPADEASPAASSPTSARGRRQSDAATPFTARTRRQSDATDTSFRVSAATMQGTPEPTADEASPAPSTPTPVRVRPGTNSALRQSHSSSAIRQSHAATPLLVSTVHKEATSTPSPQSSDAENKPPSSLPESVRPPLSAPRFTAKPVFSPPPPDSTRRLPLAETTPAHVNRSPSKRNMLGGVKSTLPWSPTALENVFLNSPVKANLAAKSSGSGQGQGSIALAFPDMDLESAGLRKVVGAVKQGMSDEEKKMSVGEWINFNAMIAEERFRRECEERVMTFEKEGARALRSLEGIECNE